MPHNPKGPFEPHKHTSKTKALPKKTHSKSPAKQSVPSLPLPFPIQQQILNHFQTSLSLPTSPSPNLQKTIQSVKSSLYARDFATAFGSQEFLHAYAARWSPSRALGYAQLLISQQEESLIDLNVRGEGESREGWNVICLGGGAGAELVGISAALGETGKHGMGKGRVRVKMELVDSADWREMLDLLAQGLEGLMGEGYMAEHEFHRVDLLDSKAMDVLEPLLVKADLITVFFTLNELYAVGLAATTRFLLEIGEVVRPGARVCVVDSAGSYAGVSFEQDQDEENVEDGKAGEGKQKRYPMAWMLDHTMLELASKDKKKKMWKKILDDDSRWFRREKGLEYPLPLEDMRYQVHIFERL